MSRRTPSLSLCALAVTAMMAQASAMAAPSPTDEELSRVKIYGSVSIAQDSASQWGPWEQFEPPAAGPAPVEFLAKATSDLYRPVALVNPADNLCVAGGICGFGAFQSQSMGGGMDSPSGIGYGDTLTGDVHPYQLMVNVSDVLSDSVRATAKEASVQLPDAITILSKTLSTGTFLNAQSPTLYRYRSDRYVADDESYMARVDRCANDDAGINPYAIQATWFKGNTYSANDSESGVSQNMWGVVGRVTAAEDMTALRQSPSATYYGYGAPSQGNLSTTVEVHVNYGTQQFQATFNGGVDAGPVYTGATTSGGQAVVYGRVGFVAEGTISGSTFKSTSVSAADATAISGSVVGAFFGPQAAALGGVADITKSKAAVSPPPIQMPPPINMEQPAVVTTTQVISTPGYTNARVITPFLATKLNKE